MDNRPNLCTPAYVESGIIYLLLAAFVVLPVYFAYLWWRDAMRADLYFQYAFFSWAFILPAMAGLVTVVGSLVEGEELPSLLSYALVFAWWLGFFLTFYTAGFIHGRIRKRRSEGVIG